MSNGEHVLITNGSLLKFHKPVREYMYRYIYKKTSFQLSRLNCFSENPEFGGSVSSRTELDFGHVATRNENNKNRGCYFCKIQRIKTKSGWKTKSRFKCAKCNVILCMGERGSPRNCFHLYHEMLKNRIAYQ